MLRARSVFAIVLVAALSGAATPSAQEITAPVPGSEIETAPVEVDGAVLFYLRGLSSLPAEVRARRVRDRIIAAAADATIPDESLRTIEIDGATQIVAGETPLLSLVDADASLEQVQRRALAAVHLARLRQAIDEYRDARSPAALRNGAIRSLAATLLLALSIVVLRWLSRRLDTLLAERLKKRIHTVGIQSFEVVRAERIWKALQSGLVALRTLTILALVLLYVGFVLSRFPLTRGLSHNMVAFALRPLQVIGNGIVRSIPSLMFLAVLFFVVRLVLRLTRLFFDAVARRTVTLQNFDPEWAQPTYKVVRIAIVAFGLVVAYPYIPGSGSAAFQGVSLFIGIVFSLGSSSAIANIIAGYMMTYRRAFRVGDRIKVGNVTGDVIEMRLQVTHLRSAKNEEIIVPNSQILASDILNYSSLARTHGLVLHTQVGIGYEVPWRQVEAMLMMAAERTRGVSSEPRPFVLEKALGDYAVVYELNAYCTNVQAMYQMYAELHRHILDIFNEYGIQIMTPSYESDPVQPKIVPPGEWYAAPATGSEANVNRSTLTVHR